MSAMQLDVFAEPPPDARAELARWEALQRKGWALLAPGWEPTPGEMARVDAIMAFCLDTGRMTYAYLTPVRVCWADECGWVAAVEYRADAPAHCLRQNGLLLRLGVVDIDPPLDWRGRLGDAA